MDITDLVYIDANGYTFSDYPAFLTWLQDTYKSIYGADLYLEADSQDGQFLAILAKAFYDTAALGASIYNSFSPVTAQGTGLSRNVKISGISRRSATHSTVELTVVGSSGTVITNGIAIDALNQKWDLPASVTIPIGGTITVTATAQDAGAVQTDANTITTIFTPTLGWQTVNNAAIATVGVAVETDSELRARQIVSVANPSLTVFDGTVGGVANLDGVTNVKGYENDSGSADGNGIPAHNIALVVLGGDDTAICNMIALHKTPGVGTYGSVPVVVYDAHGMPLTISFSRPTQDAIDVVVNLTTLAGWSADYISLIQQAVTDSINALDIGDDVLYTKLYVPAYLVGTPAYATFDIDSIQICLHGGSPTAANLTIAWNHMATCQTSHVTVNA